jgi:hypothetical protein
VDHALAVGNYRRVIARCPGGSKRWPAPLPVLAIFAGFATLRETSLSQANSSSLAKTPRPQRHAKRQAVDGKRLHQDRHFWFRNQSTGGKPLEI